MRSISAAQVHYCTFHAIFRVICKFFMQRFRSRKQCKGTSDPLGKPEANQSMSHFTPPPKPEWHLPEHLHGGIIFRIGKIYIKMENGLMHRFFTAVSSITCVISSPLITHCHKKRLVIQIYIYIYIYIYIFESSPQF